MMGVKSIETPYRGYNFRSRLEARWAVFFDAAGIQYQYEPQGFNLSGLRYLPDFYLPEWKTWIEVKPKLPDPTDKREREWLKKFYLLSAYLNEQNAEGESVANGYFMLCGEPGFPKIDCRRDGNYRLIDGHVALEARYIIVDAEDDETRREINRRNRPSGISKDWSTIAQANYSHVEEIFKAGKVDEKTPLRSFTMMCAFAQAVSSDNEVYSEDIGLHSLRGIPGWFDWPKDITDLEWFLPNHPFSEWPTPGVEAFISPLYPTGGLTRLYFGNGRNHHSPFLKECYDIARRERFGT